MDKDENVRIDPVEDTSDKVRKEEPPPPGQALNSETIKNAHAAGDGALGRRDSETGAEGSMEISK